MAFSNIENSEKLKIIDIAIIQNEEFENSEIFKEALKNLSDEANENRLFAAKYVTEEEAKDLLKNDEISGYLIIKECTPKVVVQSNGINETIIKFAVEEISQQEEIIKNMLEKAIEEYRDSTPPDFNSMYANIYKEALEKTEENSANIENISSENLSYTMIEYYTLIAMTCLYGGILGMTAINQRLANMSSNGKRVAISPAKKGSLILSSSIASYIIQLIGVALLFIYTIFVLKINYGDNLRTYHTPNLSTDALPDYHLEYA